MVIEDKKPYMTLTALYIQNLNPRVFSFDYLRNFIIMINQMKVSEYCGLKNVHI